MNISRELLHAIVSYLGTKPYAEVAQIIGRIQQEAQSAEARQTAPGENA